MNEKAIQKMKEQMEAAKKSIESRKKERKLAATPYHERLKPFTGLFDNFPPRFVGESTAKVAINVLSGPKGTRRTGAMDSNDKMADFKTAIGWLAENEGKKNKSGDKFMSLGYLVSQEDPFVFIDLDHCAPNGKVEGETATKIHEALQNAGYFEYSQSGQGTHYLVPAPMDWKKRQLEQGSKIGPICVNGQMVEVYFGAHAATLTGRDAKSLPWEEWSKPKLLKNNEKLLDSLVVTPAREAQKAANELRDAQREEFCKGKGPEPEEVPSWVPNYKKRMARANEWMKKREGKNEGRRDDHAYITACAIRRGFWLSREDTLRALLDWNEGLPKEQQLPDKTIFDKIMSAEKSGNGEWGYQYKKKKEAPIQQPFKGSIEAMKEAAVAANEATNDSVAKDEIDCSDSSSFVLDEDDDENLGDNWGFGDAEHTAARDKMLAAVMEPIGGFPSFLAEYVRICHAKCMGTIADEIAVGQGFFVLGCAMVQDKFKDKDEKEANGAEGFDRLKFYLNTGLKTPMQFNVVTIAPSGAGKDALFKAIGAPLLAAIGKEPIADTTSKEGAIREFTAARNSDRYFRINEMRNVLDASSYTYGVTKMTIDAFDTGTLQKVNSKTGDSAKCPFAFPCLLGSIQPDTLARAATRSDSAVGLFRRLLYVYAAPQDLFPKFDPEVDINNKDGQELLDKLKVLIKKEGAVRVKCLFYNKTMDEVALKYKKEPKLKEIAGTLYGMLMPKVAWCLYQCDDLSRTDIPEVMKAWQNAKIVCDYFMETAKRVAGLIGGYDERVQIEKEKRDLVLAACEREFKRNHGRAPVSRVFRGKVESRVKDMRDFREILRTLTSMGKLYWEEDSPVILKEDPEAAKAKNK